MKTSHLIVAALGATLSLCAHAAVTGLRWVEVDNAVVDPSSDPIAGAAWLANPAGWRTFDLMLTGGTGCHVTGFNFGHARFPDLDPHVIYTDGAVFNHTLGGNVRTPNGPLYGFAPLLQFDTFTTIGDLDSSNATSNPAWFNLDDGLFGLRGGVTTTPENAQAFGSEGTLRVLRLTISADFTYLGNYNAPDGLISQAEVVYTLDGVPGGVRIDQFALPTIIPSSSTVGALALGLLPLSQRRRDR